MQTQTNAGNFPAASIGILVRLTYSSNGEMRWVNSDGTQPVTARTVNYELDLLRGVMKYAGCWTPELVAGYQSLPEAKSKRGQFVSEQQLAKIITTASKNEAWQVAMYCAAVAIGTGCRGGEVQISQARHFAENAVDTQHRILDYT